MNTLLIVSIIFFSLAFILSMFIYLDGSPGQDVTTYLFPLLSFMAGVFFLLICDIEPETTKESMHVVQVLIDGTYHTGVIENDTINLLK